MSNLQQQTSLEQLPINATASGNNIIITGVLGSKILVYSFTLICSAAVSIKFIHGVTDFFPAMPFLVGGAWDKDTILGEPLFVTALDEDFIINLSGANPVTGVIWFKRG